MIRVLLPDFKVLFNICLTAWIWSRCSTISLVCQTSMNIALYDVSRLFLEKVWEINKEKKGKHIYFKRAFERFSSWMYVWLMSNARSPRESYIFIKNSLKMGNGRKRWTNLKMKTRTITVQKLVIEKYRKINWTCKHVIHASKIITNGNVRRIW